jgi:hypothetical protein
MVVASIGDCPRCKGRDGVTIELEPDLSSNPSVSSEPADDAPSPEASTLDT